MRYTLILLFFFLATCSGVTQNAPNESELQIELESLINQVSELNGSPQPVQTEAETKTEPTQPQTVDVAEVLISKAGKKLTRVLGNLKKRFLRKADKLAAEAGEIEDVPEAAQEMQDLETTFRTAATKMASILSDMTTFFNKADLDMKEILQMLPKKAKKNVIRKVRFHFGKKFKKPRGRPMTVAK